MRSIHERHGLHRGASFFFLSFSLSKYMLKMFKNMREKIVNISNNSLVIFFEEKSLINYYEYEGINKKKIICICHNI